jgi:ATP-dependent Clp protease protease subunit
VSPGNLGGSLGFPLAEQRLVMAGGLLDRDGVNEVGSGLLLLDSLASDPIRLVVNSPGGPLVEVGPLLDVLDGLASPVEVAVLGRAEGTAAVLVAAAPGRRLAGPRAAMTLRLGGIESGRGPADALDQLVGELVAAREVLIARLAERTGRTEAWLADQLDRGGPLRAREAVEAGLVDGLVAR